MYNNNSATNTLAAFSICFAAGVAVGAFMLKLYQINKLKITS